MDLVTEDKAWRIGDGKLSLIKERWIGVTNQSNPSITRSSEMFEKTVNELIGS